MRICTGFVLLSLSAVLALGALPTPPSEFYFEVRAEYGGMTALHRKVWGSATRMRSSETSLIAPPADRHTNILVDNTTSFEQTPSANNTCNPIPLAWPPAFVDGIAFDLGDNVTCPGTEDVMCDEYNGTLVLPVGGVLLKFYFLMDTNIPFAALGYLGGMTMPLNITFVEGVQDPTVFLTECFPPPVLPPTEYPCAIHMKLRTVIRALADMNITSEDEQWYQDGYWKWNSVFVNPTGLPPAPHNFTEIGRPDLNITFHDDFLPPHCDVNPLSSIGLPINYADFTWTKVTPVEFKGYQCDQFHGISPTITMALHFIAGTPLLLGGNGTFFVAQLTMTFPLTVEVVTLEVQKRMPVSLFSSPCTAEGPFPPAPEPNEQFILSCFPATSSSPVVEGSPSTPLSNAWTTAAAPAMLALAMAAAL